MKITLFTPALAAILGLALAGVPVTVQAQTAAPATEPVTTTPDTTTTPAPAKTTKPKKTEYKGSLLVIDATANTITVQSGKNKLVLAIAPTTMISKDMKPALLTDFVVGNKVTSGSYTKDADGTMTAATLRTKTPKPKPAAAPAPATPAAQ